MIDEHFGHIEIKLDQLIKERKISKNKVANLAQMQRTQLTNYCRGNIQRVDLAILSRLCYALNCSVSDILEYVPNEENK